MTSIPLQAGDHLYEAVVGWGLLERAGELISSRFNGADCAIVSDNNVAARFAETLQQSLISAGFKPTLITIAAGEKSKTLASVEEVCHRMNVAGLDRASFLVALGGGVVGDLAGFVAAIYQRGIPYVQVPTTLLAQVDSAIGGKTGVNTLAGKNMIGASHHPILVIADIATLGELPLREWNQGFAEIIKHAIIRDAEMLETLTRFDRNDRHDPEALVRRNIEIKAAIVAADDRETTGERALLNFGHTVGHAIERAGEYRDFLHGEAVSLGIVAACHVSRRRAGFSEAEQKRVIEVLRGFDLPTALPAGFSRERILEAVPFDKKFERNQVRFVVTPRIGSARLATDVTMKDIEEAIGEL